VAGIVAVAVVVGHEVVVFVVFDELNPYFGRY